MGETRSPCVTGLKHQMEKRHAQTILLDWTCQSMRRSVCIVDDAGGIVREAKVASEPDSAAGGFRRSPDLPLQADRTRQPGRCRSGYYSALADAGLPVICVETRHMRAVSARRRSTTPTATDARGMAQMMRAGLYRPVHVKTLRSQKLCACSLTHRKLLQYEGHRHRERPARNLA